MKNDLTPHQQEIFKAIAAFVEWEDNTGEFSDASPRDRWHALKQFIARQFPKKPT